MLIVWTQAIYLVASVAMTVYVAHTLKTNGRVFLLKTFKGDESITDSINNLLVMGFYLINVGWVLFWTKYGTKPDDLESAMEFVTSKVGIVILILGVMHFFNLRLFWKIQHKGDGDRPKKNAPQQKVPVQPTYIPVDKKD